MVELSSLQRTLLEQALAKDIFASTDAKHDELQTLERMGLLEGYDFQRETTRYNYWRLTDDGRKLLNEPVIISLYRHYTEPELDNNGKKRGGWAVWMDVFVDIEMRHEIPAWHGCFLTKKDAVIYCKKHLPGVRVKYGTEASRKAL